METIRTLGQGTLAEGEFTSRPRANRFVNAGEEKVKVDQAAIGRPAGRDATNPVVVESLVDAEPALKIVPGPDVVAREDLESA